MSTHRFRRSSLLPLTLLAGMFCGPWLGCAQTTTTSSEQRARDDAAQAVRDAKARDDAAKREREAKDKAAKAGEPAARGEARPGVIADPAFLEQWAATFRFRLGNPTGITLTPDGSAVLFLRSGPRSFVNDLYEFDVTTGRERVLLTAQQVLQGGEEKLTAEELARRERMRMASRGIASFQLSDDGAKILVPLSGRLFVIDRATGAKTELKGADGFPIDPRFSPDGRMVACVRDGDVYVADIAANAERRLTTKPSPAVTNGLAEFVAQEEMKRFRGYWFSPDASMLAYAQADTAGLEVFTIMDPTDPAKSPQTWPYPRPGKKNADVRLGVLSLTDSSASPQTVWARWDRERYPYLASVVWAKDSPLTIVVQNREQTEQLSLVVDPKTGEATTLLTERDAAWINIDQDFPKWLDGGKAFLWSTERNGAYELEMRGRDGALLATLCGREINYRDGLAGLDETSGFAYVIGGTEPTETHLYRVPLNPKAGKPERLTTEPGMHGAVFAKKSAAHVRTFSGLDGTPRWRVVRADGSEAGALASVRETPPFVPNVEFADVAAGGRTFEALLVRPRNFEKGRTYPVIVSVYGGPGVQVVTKNAGAQLLNQWYADHGFVVVAIDNRGTPARGREWERSIKNDFITEPLRDQVVALQALGAKFPELDLSRVGIYGWSFGGYFSAMAVMREPEVFRAGVAGAPVCAWEDYDTHYTERYIGTPQTNPEGYRTGNVMTWAKDLRRPLLIIHGTADDNVYFMHALKMSDSLFRAGKQHDFLALAGFTHMVPDPLVTRRLYSRVADYFVEHLSDRAPK